MRTVGPTLFCGMAFLLAGCAIHPEPEDVTAPDATIDIVQRIRCEARAVVLQLPAGVPNSFMVYRFTFKIMEKDDLTGVENTLADPFSRGTFGLNLSGKNTRHRTTERRFIFEDSFAELLALNVQADCPSHTPHGRWIYPITGRIGMDEVINTYVDLDGPTNYSDTLKFTTRFYGNLNPTITLSPPTTSIHLTKSTGTLTADRSDEHQVKVTIGQTSKQAADTFEAEEFFATQQRILDLLE